MNKTYTSYSSGIFLFTAMLFMLLLASCTARVEREPDDKKGVKAPTAVKEKKTVTVAAIETTSEEAYFDLIAETSGCLGENLWIGGKVESADKMSVGKTGDISEIRIYEVKELTATGINSNSSYTLGNGSGMIKAVYNDKGVVYIQLSEGQLQLKPKFGDMPITVAYNPTTTDSYLNGMVGNWSCQ